MKRLNYVKKVFKLFPDVDTNSLKELIDELIIRLNPDKLPVNKKKKTNQNKEKEEKDQKSKKSNKDVNNSTNNNNEYQKLKLKYDNLLKQYEESQKNWRKTRASNANVKKK